MYMYMIDLRDTYRARITQRIHQADTKIKHIIFTERLKNCHTFSTVGFAKEPYQSFVVGALIEAHAITAADDLANHVQYVAPVGMLPRDDKFEEMCVKVLLWVEMLHHLSGGLKIERERARLICG